MKLGGDDAMNFWLLIDEEHKDCRNRKQCDKAPDVGKKINTPFFTAFLSILRCRPIGNLDSVNFHALAKAASIPRRGRVKPLIFIFLPMVTV